MVFLSGPNIAKMQNVSKAGISPAPIWFSQYPVYAGDKVKIYTALYNNSEYNISGELHFFNNKEFIDKTNFELPANSGNNDVWINWTALKGDIEIGVEIKSLAIKDAKNNLVFDISLEDNESVKNKISIDYKKEESLNEKENDVTEKEEKTEGTEVEFVEVDEKENILDKIDGSVMDFLNKITKNKIDESFDIIGEEQIKKLESKKNDLNNKINQDTENKAIKLDTTKSSTTTMSSQSEASLEQAETPRKVEKEEIKNKISTFFENVFYKSYLFLLSVLIFFLNHKVFLFLLIFFTIYLIIKKIIRFFVG